MPLTINLRDKIPVRQDLQEAAMTPEEALLATQVGDAIEARVSELASAGNEGAVELCQTRSIAFTPSAA